MCADFQILYRSSFNTFQRASFSAVFILKIVQSCIYKYIPPINMSYMRQYRFYKIVYICYLCCTT